MSVISRSSRRTSCFSMPMRRLRAGLRGRVTGLAWPSYVLDIPGGHGKGPLGPDYFAPDGQVRDPWGRNHTLAPGEGGG